MPIIKHRENFSEILARAANQKIESGNRNFDTLVEIKEQAASTSRRLSTRLSTTLRKSTSDLTQLGLLGADVKKLREVYADTLLTKAKGKVTFQTFVEYTNIPDNPFFRNLFQTEQCDSFPAEKFICRMWDFCTTDEVDFAIFLFSSHESDGEIATKEIERIIYDIHGPDNPQEVDRCLSSLHTWLSSVRSPPALDKSAFMEFCQTHKKMFSPLKRLRRGLVEQFGGKAFWRKQTQCRYQVEVFQHTLPRVVQGLFHSYFLVASSSCYAILKYHSFHLLRIFFSVLALLFIVIQTSEISLSGGMKAGELVCAALIDFYFIMEGGMKLIALKAQYHIRDALGQPARSVLDTIRSSGVLPTIASILSLAFGSSVIGDWAKLVRLGFITSNALRRMESIDVLMSGIVLGSRSLLSTWLLLVIVFIIYSSLAVTLFGLNDPAHFGSIPTALFTFFQISTFDNWGAIMYINMYGCDRFPSDYVVLNGSLADPVWPQESYDRLGRMFMPLCSHPESFPVLAPILFISFVVVAGFILVSLTVAVVTSGINDRLEELRGKEEKRTNQKLKKADMYRKESIEEVISHNSSDGWNDAATAPAEEKESRSANEFENSILHNKEMLLMVLKQVWKDQEEFEKRGVRPAFKRLRSIGKTKSTMSALEESITMERSSLWCRMVASHPFYQYFQVVCICLVVLLELATIGPIARTELEIVSMCQAALQCLYVQDIAFRIHAQYPSWRSFFHDSWNTADFLLMLLTVVPIFSQGHVGRTVQRYLSLLRVLRILKLLKLLNWIIDLNVILRATAASAKALTYVIVLLFLFFFHFGVAGVFLFAENDPYFFGNIGKSFITLFQISTLDDWSIIARTNMYGCDLFGYQTGEEFFDAKCEHPNGLGWVAAWYFFFFIVFGTMVLLSLFIGIIIASMEIIKMSIKDEDAIWAKVAQIQAERRYITPATISNLLEIFDLIDVGANGMLTMVELKPILELVSKSEAVQFNIFMKVDQDYSGRVDFAEFLELVHILGDAYKKHSIKLSRENRNSSKAHNTQGSSFLSIGATWTSKTMGALLAMTPFGPEHAPVSPEKSETRPSYHKTVSMESTEDAKGYSLTAAKRLLRESNATREQPGDAPSDIIISNGEEKVESKSNCEELPLRPKAQPSPLPSLPSLSRQKRMGLASALRVAPNATEEAKPEPDDSQNRPAGAGCQRSGSWDSQDLPKPRDMRGGGEEERCRVQHSVEVTASPNKSLQCPHLSDVEDSDDICDENNNSTNHEIKNNSNSNGNSRCASGDSAASSRWKEKCLMKQTSFYEEKIPVDSIVELRRLGSREWRSAVVVAACVNDEAASRLDRILYTLRCSETSSSEEGVSRLRIRTDGSQQEDRLCEGLWVECCSVLLDTACREGSGDTALALGPVPGRVTGAASRGYEVTFQLGVLRPRVEQLLESGGFSSDVAEKVLCCISGTVDSQWQERVCRDCIMAPHFPVEQDESGKRRSLLWAESDVFDHEPERQSGRDLEGAQLGQLTHKRSCLVLQMSGEEANNSNDESGPESRASSIPNSPERHSTIASEDRYGSWVT